SVRSMAFSSSILIWAREVAVVYCFTSLFCAIPTVNRLARKTRPTIDITEAMATSSTVKPASWFSGRCMDILGMPFGVVLRKLDQFAVGVDTQELPCHFQVPTPPTEFKVIARKTLLELPT